MRPFPLPLAPVLALLVAALAPPARAADRTWDGGGDGTSWSVAANWSDDTVPGAADHALIGAASVVLTADAAVGRLSLGAGATLTAAGYRLALGAGPHDVAPDAVLVVGHNAGSQALTFDGPLAVRGRMDWGGGDVYAPTYGQPPGGKVLTVSPGGTLRWTGATSRLIGCALVNQGTIRWEAGSTSYYQGYSFSSSGLFDIALATDAELRGVGVNNVGPWFIPSTGTVRKSGAGRATFAQVELRTLGGAVDVQEGTLLLDYTTRWENATVAVAAGATLHLAGNRNPHTVAGTLAGSPEGTFIVSGLPGAFHSALYADAAGGVVDVGGTGLQVGYAELGGGGNPAQPAPTNRGLIRLVGDREHYVSGAFVNEGTLRWESAARLLYYMTASFTNSGLFEMAPEGERDFLMAGINGIRPGPLVNTGTLRKTGPGRVNVDVEMRHTRATVDVQAGTLVQRYEGLWDDASVAVAAGATLRLDAGPSEPQIVAGTLQGEIAGTFQAGNPASGVTWLVADPARGGRLNFTGTGLQVRNARLGGNDGATAFAGPTNAGLIRLVGTGDNYVGGAFRNEGTLRWEDGRFLILNATLTNAGLFEIALATNLDFSPNSGGTVVNTGTIRQSGTSTVTSYAAFTNRGRVVVAAGTLVMAGTFTNALEGTVAGTGTLDVRPLNNDPARVQNFGTVAPGPSDTGAGVGTLSWLGAFRMDQQARLLVEVGPGSAGDRLAVSGTAALASQLVTRVVGGYAPAPGDAFNALTASGVAGTFATVSTVVGGGNVVFEPDYAVAGKVTLRAVEGEPVPPFVVTPSPIVAGGFRTVALLGDGFAPGTAATLVCVDCADPGGPNARIEGDILATAEDRIEVRFDLTDDLAIGGYNLVLRASSDSTAARVWVAPYVALPLLTPVGPQALVVRPAPAAGLIFENLYNLTNAGEPTLFWVEVEPPPGPVRFDPVGVQLAPGETAVPRGFFARVPATSEHAQTLTFAGGVDPADVRFPGQPPLPDDPRVPFEAPQDVQFRVAGGLSPYHLAEYLAEITMEAAAAVGVTVSPDSALAGSLAVVDELLYGDGVFDKGALAPSARAESQVLGTVVLYSPYVLATGAVIYILAPESVKQELWRRLNEGGAPPPPCGQMPETERQERITELKRLKDLEYSRRDYGGTVSSTRLVRFQAELDRLERQRRSAAADPCNRDEPVIPQRPRAPVDPNDKLAEGFRGCEVVGVGEEARCGRYLIPLAERDSALTYTIRFENLPAATAPAEFVTITDVLDANLDPASFEFLGSTADSLLTIEQNGQTLTFRFTGIDLPPNVTAPEGEGAVTYRVRPRPELVDGTEIRNGASIVFDFNPSIETPEVVHVVRATSDLALTVAADTVGAVGQPLAYAFTVANAEGADPAEGATLTAPLPAGTALLGVASTVGACAEADRVVTCGLGALAPGASANVTLTLRPDAAGPLALTATAASATFEATWYDGAVAVETQVNPDTGAEPGGGLPATYVLAPNAPNPVAGEGRIRFGLPRPGRTTLVVYDVLGREVARLVDGELPAGWHEARLAAGGLASGTYVYRLTSGDFAQARRMTVVH